MAKIIVQEKVGEIIENSAVPDKRKTWVDIQKCNNQAEAKKVILREAPEKGAENLRIIMPVAHCETKVVFIDDLDEDNEEEINVSDMEAKTGKGSTSKKNIDDEKLKEVIQQNKEIEEKKIKSNKKPKPGPGNHKTYEEEDLKLLYFKSSCERGYWTKTTDFDDMDRGDYPSWFTFHQNFGSKSNLIDAVCSELKKDKVPKEYQEIIETHYGKNHSGVYVIKKLSEAGK